MATVSAPVVFVIASAAVAYTVEPVVAVAPPTPGWAPAEGPRPLTTEGGSPLLTDAGLPLLIDVPRRLTTEDGSPLLTDTGRPLIVEG